MHAALGSVSHNNTIFQILLVANTVIRSVRLKYLSFIENHLTQLCRKLCNFRSILLFLTYSYSQVCRYRQQFIYLALGIVAIESKTGRHCIVSFYVIQKTSGLCTVEPSLCSGFYTQNPSVFKITYRIYESCMQQLLKSIAFGENLL